jgi:hypothetical protein
VSVSLLTRAWSFCDKNLPCCSSHRIRKAHAYDLFWFWYWLSFTHLWNKMRLRCHDNLPDRVAWIMLLRNLLAVCSALVWATALRIQSRNFQLFLLLACSCHNGVLCLLWESTHSTQLYQMRKEVGREMNRLLFFSSVDWTQGLLHDGKAPCHLT